MSEQYVTFVIDGELYGVPAHDVREVLRSQPLTRVPLAPEGVAGLVNVRGEVVLAVDPRPRLGLPPADADRVPMMVVVHVAGEPVSLLVDEIGDVVSVTPEQYVPTPESLGPELRVVLPGTYTLADRLMLALAVDEAVSA
jgi:purine-binding chemotaxis protein CheW